MEEAIKFLSERIPELQESLSVGSWQIIAGSGDLSITTFSLYMFVMVLVVAALVIAAAGRAKGSLVPEGRLVSLVDYGYNFVSENLCKGTIGHGYKKHVPFLATLFFFILVCNFVGLIPGAKAATGSLNITWALAIISFVYFIAQGVKAHGALGYIKSIAPSGLPGPMVPIVWVLEAFSTLLRALTLAVRLYGNMFAGHMALGVFSLGITAFFQTCIATGTDILTGSLGVLVCVIFLLFMYTLEVLVAFLQAYVFTILSAVYISLATSSH